MNGETLKHNAVTIPSFNRGKKIMHKHEDKSDKMKKETGFYDKNIFNGNPKGYIHFINLFICIASAIILISFAFPLHSVKNLTSGGDIILVTAYPWQKYYFFITIPIYSLGAFSLFASYKKWNVSRLLWWYWFIHAGVIFSFFLFFFFPESCKEISSTHERFFGLALVFSNILLFLAFVGHLFSLLIRRKDKVLGTVTLHCTSTLAFIYFISLHAFGPGLIADYGVYISYLSLCLMLLGGVAIFVSIHLEKRKAKLPVVPTKNSSGIGTEDSAEKHER